jgi:hypothetical protein
MQIPSVLFGMVWPITGRIYMWLCPINNFSLSYIRLFWLLSTFPHDIHRFFFRDDSKNWTRRLSWTIFIGTCLWFCIFIPLSIDGVVLSRKHSFWISKLRRYDKAFSGPTERKRLRLGLAGLNIEMSIIYFVNSSNEILHPKCILSHHYDIKFPEWLLWIMGKLYHRVRWTHFVPAVDSPLQCWFHLQHRLGWTFNQWW